VTFRHKTGMEAQPSAPARRWAFSLSVFHAGGHPCRRLGVLVVDENYLARMMVQLGLERDRRVLFLQQ
jgi:hypothetical protein